MSWLAVDDEAPTDPKVLRAGCEVFGFAVLCAAWSAGKGGEGKVEDFFVPEYAAAVISPNWDDLARRAVKAKLFTKPSKSRGERGWFIDQNDPLLHILTREQVLMNRERGKTTRRKEAVREVRLRDGDECRYCGKPVDWSDRVSGMGGTYDHPDPEDRDAFVVCCFECNRAKGKRTPEQWIKAEPKSAHTLKPPPDVPLIGEKTSKQFQVALTSPTRATMAQTPPTASQPPTGAQAASTGPGSSDTAHRPGPGATCDLPAEVSHTSPVRDGSGRVGSGAQPVRAGPRRTPRGSRGRGRRPPPTQGDRKD